MPDINRLSGNMPQLPQMNKAQAPVAPAPEVNAPAAPVTAPAAAASPVAARPQADNLLEPQLLEGALDRASTQQIQRTANVLPRPAFLQALENPYAHLSDKALLETLMQGRDNQNVPAFQGILRKAKEIADSGVLRGFRELAARGIEVPASEFHRTTSDDAVLVMKGFAKMSPDQIHQLKEKAYHHREVAPELQGALDKNYYGSPQHKVFGALVEQLTGGVLSAEEAMAMCPCGGIPGDGAKEVPLIGKIDAVQRHAMRHDALGFLMTRFGVGPGYGSKTTPFGLASDNPLAGQVLGIAREIFHEASVFSSGEKAATPDRFQA